MTNSTNAGSFIIGSKGFLENKLELDLEHVNIGMTLAETVFNPLGAIIIHKDTVLTLSMIKTLNRVGIRKIKIYADNQEQKINDPIQLFKDRYTASLSVFAETVKNIYSGKPLDIQSVNQIVDSIIDKTQNEKIIRDMNGYYEISEYEYTHSINVSILSVLIAKWMNFSDTELKSVARSGLLHDIGKTKVNRNIIDKPGPLTQEEYDEAKKHVDYGIEIIQDISDINYNEGMGILKHHEREDGSGYIYGLKSKEIHEYAKIIAVADVFDAMNSNRAYAKKIPIFEIFDWLETGRAGSLDAKIVEIFLQKATLCFIGEKFFMSNGEIGEIVYINENRFAKPLVKVVGGFLDLSKDESITLGHMI